MGRLIKKRDIDSARLTRHPLTEQALGELLSARAFAEGVRRTTKSQVIDLAFTIAQRFTGDRLRRDDDLLGQIYEQALAILPEHHRGTVAVAPEDQSRAAIAPLADTAGLRVVSDPRLVPGECRVTIDEQLSIHSTFAALRRALEPLAEDQER